jgi:S-phase kinase-associated protein 1
MTDLDEKMMSSPENTHCTTTTDEDKRMIQVVSSDGQNFNIPVRDIISASKTVSSLVEDSGIEEAVPLPNVSSKVLAKVLTYIRFHMSTEPDEFTKRNKFMCVPAGRSCPEDWFTDKAIIKEDVAAFDTQFVKEVDQCMLFDLILAANYLNIRTLLELTCQTVANMIKGKSTEEMREMFNIKNDFTPEEEEEVKRENQWAFD